MFDQTSWFRGIGLLLLLVVVFSIGLIASGAVDPRPHGKEFWRESDSIRSIPAGTRRLNWLDVEVPDEVYSLELAARLREGDTDIGYGIVIGDDQRILIILVSPLGYVTLCYDDQLTTLTNPRAAECPLPWQPWPHVKLGRASNEIQIDVEGHNIIARINREQLWKGVVGDLGNQIGWIGESFAGRAVIESHVRLFVESQATRPAH